MNGSLESTESNPPAAPQPDGAAPPRSVELHPAEVHLWRVFASRSAACGAEAIDALSPDERARASRLRFEPDRDRFVAAHAALRRILATYLGAAPASLAFGAGTQGKPFLDAPAPGRSLRFSLSHSGDLALVAVSQGREVGVDVERVRPRNDLDRFIARYLSPREQQALERVPAADRLRAFFETWTLKEAYLKACGDGLARALDAFDVTVGDARPRLLAVRDRPGDAARWVLQRVDVGEGFAASLAVEGRDWRLVRREWGG